MPTTVVWTDDGQEAIVDYLDTQTWYAGIGTGGITAAVTDAALTTEVETRQATTDSQPSADTFQMVATITATGARALDEAGIFTASSGGVMHMSATFDVINLATNDAIQMTWSLQLKDNSE